jgi:hypothetical protein
MRPPNENGCKCGELRTGDRKAITYGLRNLELQLIAAGTRAINRRDQLFPQGHLSYGLQSLSRGLEFIVV